MPSLRMETMPKTAEFLGKRRRFQFSEGDWGWPGTYSFEAEGFTVEIDYHGENDVFDTVTGEVYDHEAQWSFSTRDMARPLSQVLRMLELRARKRLERKNG